MNTFFTYHIYIIYAYLAHTHTTINWYTYIIYMGHFIGNWNKYLIIIMIISYSICNMLDW